MKIGILLLDVTTLRILSLLSLFVFFELQHEQDQRPGSRSIYGCMVLLNKIHTFNSHFMGRLAGSWLLSPQEESEAIARREKGRRERPRDMGHGNVQRIHNYRHLLATQQATFSLEIHSLVYVVQSWLLMGSFSSLYLSCNRNKHCRHSNGSFCNVMCSSVVVSYRYREQVGLFLFCQAAWQGLFALIFVSFCHWLLERGLHDRLFSLSFMD